MVLDAVVVVSRTGHAEDEEDVAETDKLLEVVGAVSITEIAFRDSRKYNGLYKVVPNSGEYVVRNTFIRRIACLQYERGSTSETQLNVTVTRIALSCGRIGRSTADTDGRTIVLFVEANLVCWRCHLKQQRSVHNVDALIVLSEPQFQLLTILQVAVSPTVELHAERRRHLKTIRLQDIVSVNQTDESKCLFDSFFVFNGRFCWETQRAHTFWSLKRSCILLYAKP
ncbi:hypothetical protein TNCV_3603271 [Trichonephila clavipes]|nr:hypothetical protein TNCV_3603271 [Trichonephila clavipes]